MAKKFPIDEFDSATQHGGRHRARRTAKDRFIEWVRVFSAAVLIAGVSYGALKFVENSSVFNGYLPSGSSSAAPTTSTLPEVSVLDGGGKNAAGVAAQILKTAGFNVKQASTLVDTDKKPVSIATTVVVITDELFRADAIKIAAQVGNPAIVVSPEFKGPITVVLGKDYKLPKN